MSTLAQTFQNETQVSHAQQRASFEVRKAKRPDYYGLLGVPSVASGVEIKQAYKAQALIWHPDKHATRDDAAKLEAAEQFKQVQAAWAVLSDDALRAAYDDELEKQKGSRES